MMFVENKILNKLLAIGRKIIPKRIFTWAQPIYHWGLSMLGTVIYGFPSCSMKVIAVTGTKGKSTTVYMIAKIFEEQGLSVAAVGSLGFKIKDKTWPNTLKMTLPGRMKLQQFLWRAKKAGVKYVVLEATSEGIAQNRLAGIKIDCAVFTNLHREHLESHGSFENYMAAKQKLFLKTKNIHILNIEDPYYEKFANFPAKRKVTYGKEWGDISLKIPNSQYPIPNKNLNAQFPNSEIGHFIGHLKFEIGNLRPRLLGDFNIYNVLAALAVGHAYGLDMEKAVATLNSIESIPGRMEVIDAEFKGLKFKVVIDYAHTPDSLKLVYQALRNRFQSDEVQSDEVQPQEPKEVEPLKPKRKLICVLGAAGGGRDKWKRPEFGRIAAEYCDEIILTNEDSYDENPEEILEQISSGFSSTRSAVLQKEVLQKEVQPQELKEVEPRTAEPQIASGKLRKILDRKEAIRTALTLARAGDIVVITGKGSETSMAVAGGRKIPWSDKEIVQGLLK